jgi:hypothetical protein
MRRSAGSFWARIFACSIPESLFSFGIWAHFWAAPGAAQKPGFPGLRYRSGPGRPAVARFAPPPIPCAPREFPDTKQAFSTLQTHFINKKQQFKPFVAGPIERTSKLSPIWKFSPQVTFKKATGMRFNTTVSKSVRGWQREKGERLPGCMGEQHSEGMRPAAVCRARVSLFPAVRPCVFLF